MENGLLFTEEEIVPWKAHWQDMPEFVCEDLTPEFQILVSFGCAADVEDFAKLIGSPVKPSTTGRQTQSIWFPEAEIGRYANKRYIVTGETE